MHIAKDSLMDSRAVMHINKFIKKKHHKRLILNANQKFEKCPNMFGNTWAYADMSENVQACRHASGRWLMYTGGKEKLIDYWEHRKNYQQKIFNKFIKLRRMTGTSISRTHLWPVHLR